MTVAETTVYHFPQTVIAVLLMTLTSLTSGDMRIAINFRV